MKKKSFEQQVKESIKRYSNLPKKFAEFAQENDASKSPDIFLGSILTIVFQLILCAAPSKEQAQELINVCLRDAKERAKKTIQILEEEEKN